MFATFRCFLPVRMKAAWKFYCNFLSLHFHQLLNLVYWGGALLWQLFVIVDFHLKLCEWFFSIFSFIDHDHFNFLLRYGVEPVDRQLIRLKIEDGSHHNNEVYDFLLDVVVVSLFAMWISSVAISTSFEISTRNSTCAHFLCTLLLILCFYDFCTLSAFYNFYLFLFFWGAA